MFTLVFVALQISNSAAADEVTNLDEVDEVADITIAEAIALLGGDIRHEGVTELIQPAIQLDLKMQGVLPQLTGTLHYWVLMVCLCREYFYL